MLEKLRDNPRAVVAALIAAGVLAVAVGASSNAPTTDETTEPASAEIAQAQEKSQEANAETAEQSEGAEEANQAETEENGAPADTASQPAPSYGPVAVTVDGDTLKATVRLGDNQTVIVRQMIANHLTTKSDSLTPEQRLYAETTLVSKLPKNDLIYPGQTISLAESTVAEVIAASKQLDQAAIGRWKAYL